MITLPRPGDLLAPIAATIAGELRFQRGRDVTAESLGWSPATELTGPDVAADSLELIALVAHINQVFHLHEHGLDDELRTAPTLGAWAEIAADAMARPDAAMTFMTSGSTGAPQACRHRVRDLATEVAAFAEMFGDRQRVLHAVAPHHIYGFLFGVMLPAALGIPREDARERTATHLRRSLRPGDLVVSFPLGWDNFNAAAGDPPPNVVGTTSTAPCPAATIDVARQAGIESIVEIYGATETAGIGVRGEPDAPFTLLPHWSRDDSDAVDVSSEHDAIHGSQASSAPTQLRRRGGSPVILMDRIEWSTDRTFHVRGRQDRAVQVGGVNVHPDRVASALRGHPLVFDCQVRLMRPDEGVRLKAFVVPTADGAARPDLTGELDRWCGEHLDAPARPRAIRLGPALPVAPNGKAVDWNVAVDDDDDHRRVA
ncbi:MAG: AMP-binding protein [Phycisphaerales bacterium]